MTETILEKIKTYKLLEIKERKKSNPTSTLLKKISDKDPNYCFFKAILRKNDNRHSIIAEIKKASPSRGVIRKNFHVAKIAKQYEDGGACCISVLTDGPSFMGKLEDLVIAKSSCNLPILRKDFIFDEYQILESKAIGADCILIILSALDFVQAKELESCALEYGLEVLIEVHCRNELDKANQMQSRLIGVNNRNLHTFKTDRLLTKILSPYVAEHKVLISESGLSNRKHLDELTEFGAKGFLIGETLMKSNNITLDLSKLI